MKLDRSVQSSFGQGTIIENRSTSTDRVNEHDTHKKKKENAGKKSFKRALCSFHEAKFIYHISLPQRKLINSIILETVVKGWGYVFI